MTSPAMHSVPDERASGFATHEVFNQPGALDDYNAYSDDEPLVEAVRVFGADWAADHLKRAGALVGSEKVQHLARQANRHPPELRTHDRFGHRIDIVEFHPAYHELMSLIFGCETHSFAWTHDRPGAHVARAALSYLWNQGENGICCPMAMSFASVPALRHDPDLLGEWAPLIKRSAYDARAVYAKEKAGVTVGMAMTEKQGGSDLRATMTTARPATARRGSGAPYLLTGHKWFFSVPMSDLFLTLAQTDKGLSCFLATGWLPDGSRNRLKLQRLKDKCGNKSNASSEVEFYDLHAVMLGDEGRGIRTLIEMAQLTRLDLTAGSSGLMRQALSQAIHHTANRRAFQRPLVDLSIMRNVVADLAVESEAMTVDVHAARMGAGPLRSGPRRSAAVAHLHAGGQVLGLQARAAVRGGGARMPRRQRLHCRPSDGAPLPRSPAERHLGRKRQCHLPRRAAFDAARAGNRRCVPRRNRQGTRRQRAARCLRRRSCAVAWPIPQGSSRSRDASWR